MTYVSKQNVQSQTLSINGSEITKKAKESTYCTENNILLINDHHYYQFPHPHHLHHHLKTKKKSLLNKSSIFIILGIAGFEPLS